MAYEVVTRLSSGLNYFGHCITMNNYFTSISLFIDLASKVSGTKNK